MHCMVIMIWMGSQIKSFFCLSNSSASNDMDTFHLLKWSYAFNHTYTIHIIDSHRQCSRTATADNGTFHIIWNEQKQKNWMYYSEKNFDSPWILLHLDGVFSDSYIQIVFPTCCRYFNFACNIVFYVNHFKYFDFLYSLHFHAQLSIEFCHRIKYSYVCKYGIRS